MYAYDQKYLDDAMQNLGEAMDYAVSSYGMQEDEFTDLFIASGLSEQFGKGVPKYTVGMSGIELVLETISRSGLQNKPKKDRTGYDLTPAYWCGWILAYYQWYTGITFKKIRQHLTMREILELYPALHEASEEKFVDAVNARICRDSRMSQLRQMRRIAGYSQKLLSEKSGVSLRMIQQYEQGAKDINRASGTNLSALARILGCRTEDLMEVKQNVSKNEKICTRTDRRKMH